MHEFRISQGTTAIFSGCGGQVQNQLREISSGICVPKIRISYPKIKTGCFGTPLIRRFIRLYNAKIVRSFVIAGRGPAYTLDPSADTVPPK